MAVQASSNWGRVAFRGMILASSILTSTISHAVVNQPAEGNDAQIETAAVLDEGQAGGGGSSIEPSGPVVSSGKAGADDDGEIIVTAQKRAQSINDVGMSITAATGDALIQRGVTSTADLAKVVPGLTAQPSPFNTPVYTMRGVGFYDSTLSASPTVAVYVDEVPLPFSAMTTAAALDLERVEVLKGPQGTLFGNNTTGGAINYIAAKPTDIFSAGMSASLGRFNTADIQGFVSGPLASNLEGRLALRVVNSGDWQKSYTRSDTLGATNQLQGRMLLHWEPSEDLKVALNINGWTDKSDTQAPQRIAHELSVPANIEIGAPTLASPLSPRTSRAADWSTNLGALNRDDRFIHGSLRVDYDVANSVSLTSITAYQRYKSRALQDFDGLPRNVADIGSSGYIHSFSQELRLSGNQPGLNWVVGVNYEDDRSNDELIYNIGHSTTSIVGPVHFTPTSPFAKQDVKTLAAFGNIELEIVHNLRLQAGARYTDSRRDFAGCTRDVAGGGLADAIEFLQGVLRGGVITPIPPGTCITLNSSFVPSIDPITDDLNEDNVSWRLAVNYETGNRGLIYASVGKGYKAGSFPNTAASADVQYLPVTQESILAYEVGVKQPLFGRAIQMNAAAFYYDYSDKQLRGRVLDPVFGPLDALVQIPKSRIYGFELEAQAKPVQGLNFSVAATYINTKIREFVGYNNAGILQDFAGSEFPYSPNWQVVADGGYEWSAGNNLKAMVGASFNYNSKTTASIGEIELLEIDGYGLLDLRAGVKAADESWSVQFWGRNITNEYYWTNALQTTDGYVRFTGRPATYGVTFGIRM